MFSTCGYPQAQFIRQQPTVAILPIHTAKEPPSCIALFNHVRQSLYSRKVFFRHSHFSLRRQVCHLSAAVPAYHAEQFSLTPAVGVPEEEGMSQEHGAGSGRRSANL